MSNQTITQITTISSGYAALDIDGDRKGYLERIGGQWVALDIHASTYGHASDRIERSIGRFPTRRAAADALAAA